MVFRAELHPRDLRGRFIDVTFKVGSKWFSIIDNDSGATTYIPRNNPGLVKDYLRGRLPAARVKVGRKETQVLNANSPAITDVWIRHDQIDILKAMDRDGYFDDVPPAEPPPSSSSEGGSPHSPEVQQAARDAGLQHVQWTQKYNTDGQESTYPQVWVNEAGTEAEVYVMEDGQRRSVFHAVTAEAVPSAFEDTANRASAPDHGPDPLEKASAMFEKWNAEGVEGLQPLQMALTDAHLEDPESVDAVRSALSDIDLDPSSGLAEEVQDLSDALGSLDFDTPIPENLPSAADTAADETQVPELPPEVSIDDLSPEVQRLHELPPVGFDEELSAKYGELYEFMDKKERARQSFTSDVGLIVNPRERRYQDQKPATLEQVEAYLASDDDDYQRAGIQRSYDSWLEHTEAFNAKAAEIQVYDEVYRDRGSWNRAYLVQDGHVHRRMSCPTCFPSTRFEWMTEYSDKTEDEIVNDAGDRACTVCFPSAPVAVLNQPSKMLTKSDREKAALRAERAEKKALAEKAKITIPGYQEYGDAPRDKTFNTVRGATNALSSDLSSLLFYGTGHPSAEKWQANIGRTLEALRQRGEEYDFDKVLTAARKKIEREGGRPRDIDVDRLKGH